MERKKIDKWDAIIYFDEVEKLHTITYDGKGGAIICDSDLVKAQDGFIEAMNLAEAVNKFIQFNKN